jgi:hypothetical protein
MSDNASTSVTTATTGRDGSSITTQESNVKTSNAPSSVPPRTTFGGDYAIMKKRAERGAWRDWDEEQERAARARVKAEP